MQRSDVLPALTKGQVGIVGRGEEVGAEEAQPVNR